MQLRGVRVSDDDLEHLANISRDPRILTIDLERLPGEVTLDVWEPRDFQRISYIHPDRWSVVPRTLCASAKWYGSDKVHFVAAWDNPDDPYHVARTLYPMLDRADWLITYNGKRADCKWLRTDWLEAGLHPPMPWKDVDLFATLRTQFGFESKSLAYACARLGLPGKHGKYDALQAKAAMAGDVKAQRALRRYNITDVKITEALFDRVRSSVKGVNWSLYRGDGARVCRNCGANRLNREGIAAGVTGLYDAWRCQECGTVHRSTRRSVGVPMREP
jgi:hypothetical protein